MKLTIDPATGMSGDMLIAALLDAGTRLEGQGRLTPRIEEVMRFAGSLLGETDVKATRVTRGRTTGTRLLLRLEKNDQSLPADRLHEMLVKVSRKFDFSASGRDFAERAFTILCRAEEQAHNKLDGHASTHHSTPANETAHHVHLHEAQDILLDIAGSAVAVGCLDIDMDNIVCLAPVHFGGGTVHFSHGSFPVPAPAVKAVIDSYGIPVEPGPVSKELLTPTGISLLAAFAPSFQPRPSAVDILRSQAVAGVGLGTLEFTDAAGRENGLTVFLGDE